MFFDVPPTQTTVVFNKSMGLVYRCEFNFYVTPMPIVLVDNTFRQKSVRVLGCPIAPKLRALPNVMARIGSSSSFVARFAIEPIPSPTMKWYFSHDKVYCRNPALIENHRTNIIFSNNMRILRVVNITKEDVGCYTVSADNSVGRTVEQRAYLELNFTMPTSVYSSHDIKGPIKGFISRNDYRSCFLCTDYHAHTEENNGKRT